MRELRYNLPSDLAARVQQAVDTWQNEGRIAKLWARDKSLWTNSDEDKWLGWMDIVERADVPALKALQQEVADADGGAWFAESGRNRIGHIDKSGRITEFPLATKFASPNAVAVLPNGSVWFTEIMSGKIGRIDSRKTVTALSPPSRSSRPCGITSSGNGGVWFTEETPHSPPPAPSGNNIATINGDHTISEMKLETPGAYPVCNHRRSEKRCLVRRDTRGNCRPHLGHICQRAGLAESDFRRYPRWSTASNYSQPRRFSTKQNGRFCIARDIS